MKRKSTLRKIEPPDLTLGILDASDPSLPAVKNSVASQHNASTKVSNYTANRYAMTRAIGGLVPDNFGKGYWMCGQCRKIYDTKPMANECHHADALRVQICVFCMQKHNQRLRIGECRCLTIK